MASSSTSSIQKSFTYDVFLSFRGEDTRKTFVDHLYVALDRQGIYTYKDDERIRKGERIDDELIKSIEDSKFFIIVFSKNYASSSWCLDELVKVMECHKTNEQKAYPVFYDVEPTEVRKQTGAVGKAFTELKHKVAAGNCSKGMHHLIKGVCTCIPFLQGNSTHEHNGEVGVGKWREALVDAANLAGWELKNTSDGHEAKVIQKIVEEISLELRPINYSVDEKLVGMESRIKEIESILEIDSNEVRMIGIRGMGGSGKTTLAKAVFDRLSIQFEGRSFVENVREASNNSLSGLKLLQNQVISDVLSNQSINISSVTDSKSMMKRRLRSKKILVVLDDVDHIDQLEELAGEPNWFKPGSRIIITTRDEQVLKSHGVNLIHDANLLSDAEAICLFNIYAFVRESPIQVYEMLSRQVVRYAAGLPLTIRVLGSFLCGKNELEWKDALERLTKIPLKETLEKLELSYNSLEVDYKEIFLDVACFLKGNLKNEAIRILDCCGFHAINGLRVLEQKSLITISKTGRLGMHDHLEEMGRNIVRREHPDDPNKHSRLWISKEIENVLANNSVNEATSYLKADGLLRLNPETFMKGLVSMKKLRVLVLDVNLHTNASFSDWKFNEVSQYFPDALRYLKLDFYPFQSLPGTFQADNLVGLEMRSSRIVQLWEGGERKVLYNLKYLDLFCSNLKALDLRLTPNLRQLHLQSYELVELHMPIGCLELTSVELGSPNLNRLTLTNCDNLVEHHTHNDGCPKLTVLEITHTKLKTLDLTRTPNLKRLYLTKCDELVELHMPVNGGPGLMDLQVSRSKLKTLDLTWTSNIKWLYLNKCDELVELRMHINGYLELTDLEVMGSKLKTLDLTRTPKLRQLYLEKCDELVELHMQDNGCQDLTKIEVRGSKLKTLDLTWTPNLKRLYLKKCDELLELHMHINGCRELLELVVTGAKLKTLDLGLTPKLQQLTLTKCDDLVELHMHINGCPELTHLKVIDTKLKTLDLGLTPKLQELSLTECDDLAELHMQNNGCPELTDLEVTGSKLKTLDLKLSPKLQKLTLTECHDLVELHMHIDGCPELKDLEVTGSKLKTLDIGLTPKLQRLTLLECHDLVELNTPVECLKELSWLDMSGCSLFESFFLKKHRESHEFYLTAECQHVFPLDSGLRMFKLSCIFKEQLFLSTGDLRKLISLALSPCTNFNTFSQSICGLPHLRELVLKSGIPEAPKDLDQLECLEKLYLFSTEIKLLPDNICMLKHLKSLKLDSCMHLEKLPEDIGQLECLEMLHLVSTRVKHLPDSICMLKHLKSLILEQCEILEKLPEDIGQLQCLEKLHVMSAHIKHLPDSICLLKQLKSLTLEWCKVLEKLPEDIGQLECLEGLHIMYTRIRHLPDSICLLKHVKCLILEWCVSLERLPEDIGQLKSLEKLHVMSSHIKHLPDSICLLKHLKYLMLKHCTSLEKLPEDIGQLECLDELYVMSPHIKHLPKNICLLKHLKSLQLEHCSILKKLPEDIGQLECLEMLHLMSRRIKRLPNSICIMKHLKSLILDKCEIFEELPEDIGQLIGLKKIYVMSSHIKHLPDSISMLKHLESLQLEYCWILEKLPANLGQLDRLKELILRECKLLQDVPNSICKMKCLEWFHLPYCTLIENLPEEIGHLESLKELDISGTGIRHLPRGIFSLKGLRIVGDTWLSGTSGYSFSSVQRNLDDLTSFYI